MITPIVMEDALKSVPTAKPSQYLLKLTVMNIKNICEEIYYVGVNDRTTHRFEALWPIPDGVSYNSYIVKGAEKTALIDGVELSACDRLRENISETIGAAAPDYLIINHMEPDHSGSVRVLRQMFPEMTIVGNAKTLEMVRGFYGIEDNVMKIADGDTLDLGGLTLKFILTPMVHWPETMMTWVAERAVLFTGDAFGCFGALNGAVIDRDMDTAPYYLEMYRYYSNIVGKYGMFVQKAFAKISALKVSFICPTHGPVWHDEIDRVGSVYDRLSRYEGEVGVTVVYGSMYGNTAEMAEAIAARLAERGIRNIRVHDASVSHLSYILSDIFRFKGLIVGAPTYSNTLFPPVEAVMNAIKTRDLKNRVTGVFGSFCWAPQAVKRISQYFGECNLYNDEIVSVEAKQAPGADDLARCRQLADAVADRLLQV